MDSSAPKPLPAVVGVVTVSDRAFRGEYEDRSGPAVMAYMESHFEVGRVEKRVVPDDEDAISTALTELASICCIVLTTGGTGPAPRDVTPEVTTQVCGKMLPGFGERMRAVSVEKVPTAILSRQTAGICGQALIVNLPGSPKAIAECLDPLLQAIPHAVRLAEGTQKLVLKKEHHIKGRDCKDCDVVH